MAEEVRNFSKGMEQLIHLFFTYDSVTGCEQGSLDARCVWSCHAIFWRSYRQTFASKIRLFVGKNVKSCSAC